MRAAVKWGWLLLVAPLCFGCGGRSEDSGISGDGQHSSGGALGILPEGGVNSGGDGSNQVDGGALDAPVPKQEFAGRVNAVTCVNYQKCCGDSAAFVLATCEANTSVSGATDFLGDPLVQYDPQAARDCLRELDTGSSACFIETLNIETIYSPCNRAFVGTLPLGAPCAETRQCAPVENGSVVCGADFSPGSNALVCLHYMQPPHGALGDACNCSQSESSTCPQIWNASGPNDNHAACYADDGLYCDILGGTCKQVGGLGEPCQLYYPSCKSGLFCGDDETCQPFAREGESCTQRMAECESGLVCNGVCESPHALGEPCLFYGGSTWCVAGAHCSAVSYTCVSPEPVGATCMMGTDCLSGICSMNDMPPGTCADRPLSDVWCAYVSGGTLPP